MEDLLVTQEGKVLRITLNRPDSLKRIVNTSVHSSLADVLEAERTTQAMMVTTADHLEGVRSFREKRRPSFQGE